VYLHERNPQRPYELHADEQRFSATTLRGTHLARGSRWLVLNRGVLPLMRRLRPDVVLLGGWSQPAFWTLLLAARAARIPVLAWVESTARDERSGTTLLEHAKHAFLRACTGFVVPGTASAEYLAALGVPASRITVAPNAVDPTVFATAAERAETGPVTILNVGRLDPEKGVDVAIRAVGRLRGEVRLVVAGTGREEGALRALADHVVPGRVDFLGFVPRDDLPALYAAADVYVLPSRSEQWGMTLNEAALAGLPLVASDAAGGTYDLVEDGVNGFRVPAGDADALAAALQRLVDDGELRKAAGAESRRIGARFTPEAWAAAVSARVTGG
jgi:glycosyltransferase involved in cell wall biosynthesis